MVRAYHHIRRALSIPCPNSGAWNTPLVDAEGNVYYSVANGYYSHNSPESTQNKRFYTNSLVKLDGETGELLWHYQAIPNDFWDWDLHQTTSKRLHRNRRKASGASTRVS